MHPYKLIEQGIQHPTILTNNKLPRASPRSEMLWFFSVKYVINSGEQPIYYCLFKTLFGILKTVTIDPPYRPLVRGIHWCPIDYPQERTVMRTAFPCHNLSLEEVCLCIDLLGSLEWESFPVYASPVGCSGNRTGLGILVSIITTRGRSNLLILTSSFRPLWPGDAIPRP